VYQTVVYDAAVPPKKKPSRPSLKVLYIGNFEPPHSTENHIRAALVDRGHFVVGLQESAQATWDALASNDWTTLGGKPDLILWTRTGFPWPDVRAHRIAEIQMMQRADDLHIPVVGYHLDIWWGLKRQRQILEEPFFRANLVITADGGHDEQWAEAGVNHVWFPPGVSAREAHVGERRYIFQSKLAFVGSWQGSYHDEHQHRFELVAFLKKHFRNVCEFYPRLGEHAIRGQELRDLYASVDVVVGDSCFAGSGLANYWSDRIPETLGRGGFLLHPMVPGLEQHFAIGDHLGCWNAGDWDQLGTDIEFFMKNTDRAHEIADAGCVHVQQHHTYDVRMDQLVDLLLERDML